LVDLDRISQSPFAMFSPEKNHGDNKVLEAQEWMENNPRDKISMEGMAKEAGMSLRRFNSRFESATGETATKHRQLARVDAAKVDLVNTNRPFEEISLNTGYENVSFSEGFSRKLPALRQRNTGGGSASSKASFGV